MFLNFSKGLISAAAVAALCALGLPGGALAQGVPPAAQAPIDPNRTIADVSNPITSVNDVYLIAPGGAMQPGTWVIRDTAVNTQIVPGTYQVTSGIYTGSLNIGGGVSLDVRSSGVLTPTTWAVGLYLDTGDIAMTGGVLHGLGDNEGIALYLGSGNFIQSGGSISASGINGGTGILLGSGNFTQSGGSISAIGNGDHSCAIYLTSGNFIQSGGSISASGINNGDGIMLGSGNFTQSGGTLALMPGNSHSVYLSNDRGRGNAKAHFGAGATLRPGVDFAANQGGRFATRNGSVTIASGAQVKPYLVNSLALDKGAAPNYVFLGISNIVGGTSITGQFALQNSLTIDYAYDAQAAAHGIIYTRKAWASEVASDGNMRGLLQNFEARYPVGQLPANLVQAYSRLDESTSQGEFDNATRGLTPWAATQFGNLAVQNFDLIGASFGKYLAAASKNSRTLLPGANDSDDASDAPASGYQPLSSNWQAWLTPLYRYEKIDAKDSNAADIDGSSYGFAVGAARSFEGGTLGFSANFLHGDLSGGGSDIDSDTWAFMTGFRTIPLFDGAFAPWLQLHAGYAYTDYDLKRLDTLGVSQTSSPHQHTGRVGLEVGQDLYFSDNAFRLTPSIGLDYTYAWQSSYSESNLSGVALNVGSTHLDSLRGKIGADAEYALCDSFSLGGHAYYRLEMADTHVDLDSQFLGTDIRFETTGQDYDRSSANLGVNASWNITEQISTRAGYDLTFGDHYQAHQFDLSLVWEF